MDCEWFRWCLGRRKHSPPSRFSRMKNVLREFFGLRARRPVAVPKINFFPPSSPEMKTVTGETSAGRLKPPQLSERKKKPRPEPRRHTLDTVTASKEDHESHHRKWLDLQKKQESEDTNLIDWQKSKGQQEFELKSTEMINLSF